MIEKKHCNTCKYSFQEKERNSEMESGYVEMQHCSNPVYNSPAYTHKMLLEDWPNGYCRLWEAGERKEKEYEEQLLHRPAQ